MFKAACQLIPFVVKIIHGIINFHTIFNARNGWEL